MADCTISNNVVGASGVGGGVANNIPGASLTLTNCTIMGNSAADGTGGGLYLTDNTITECLDCRFERNAAKGGGGARIYQAATGLFRECVFDGNTADTTGVEGFGGGACIADHQEYGGMACFTNCVFRNNSALDRGGAFRGGKDAFTRAELVGCVITNNTCKYVGGGVYVRDSDKSLLDTRFVMRNCLVAHNGTTATGSGAASGGGVYLCAYANPVIDSCTIVSNAVPSNSSGGGLYHRWGGTVTNTIIACNLKGSSMETGSDWCLNVGTPSDAYSYCCVWPEAPSVFLAGNGCVNADPKFSNAAAGDFSLAHGSPCVNAGVTEAWMSGAFDLSGGKRVSGSSADIGCYELFIPPGLIFTVW